MEFIFFEYIHPYTTNIILISIYLLYLSLLHSVRMGVMIGRLCFVWFCLFVDLFAGWLLLNMIDSMLR